MNRIREIRWQRDRWLDGEKSRVLRPHTAFSASDWTSGTPGFDAATKYLTLAGRDGEYYREALELLNQAEAAAAAAEEAAEAARRRAAAAKVAIAGMEFVWIPPGEYRMGSKSSEADDDERPLTRVRISQGFWLGKNEVTKGQWQAAMDGYAGGPCESGSECPVGFVTWEEVKEFIRKLNEIEGRKRYRLQTEAEWEYAARRDDRGPLLRRPRRDRVVQGQQRGPHATGESEGPECVGAA